MMAGMLPAFVGIIGGWLMVGEWWGIFVGLVLGLAAGVGLIAFLHARRSGR